MTKSRRKMLTYRQLEQLHAHLTVEGKDYLKHQVLGLGLNELDVMNDILTSHQGLVLPTIWRYV